MSYPRGVVERAMKVQEVIVRALAGKLSWIQAAEILDRSPRSIQRLRWKLEHYGYDGLFDRRRQVPSPKRAPVAEVQRVLALYRDRYRGFNVRHFHQLARREHRVRFCYAFVKKALQSAGLVAKHQPRGRHRRRREPRACFGELLHLDGSRHRWLALRADRWFTLLAVVDDATKQLLYAQLHDGGESVAAIMTALRAVVEHCGLPMALYTDRAHWAVHTPTSGSAPDRRHPTQVGRALARLGIEHILGYSPQARGRSERVNRTLQDRLVNELRVGWRRPR
jgi:helix-turn-helix protein